MSLEAVVKDVWLTSRGHESKRKINPVPRLVHSLLSSSNGRFCPCSSLDSFSGRAITVPSWVFLRYRNSSSFYFSFLSSMKSSWTIETTSKPGQGSFNTRMLPGGLENRLNRRSIRVWEMILWALQSARRCTKRKEEWADMEVPSESFHRSS